MSRQRQPKDQTLHDWVIEKTVDKTYRSLRIEGHRICTNPSQQHNCEIEGLYPDIIVYNAKTGNPFLIDEIETFVDDVEFEQWDKFGKLPVERFAVTVPSSEVERARERILDKHIRVTELWAYVTDGRTISFSRKRLYSTESSTFKKEKSDV